ncbi:MAG: hypothetical protein QW472_04240 [Candidatus Aenigmatarchaeota archaeon]
MRKLQKIWVLLLFLTFLIVYAINFSNFGEIVFAATPTPSPPSVSDSPDPQQGGQVVTFSCPSCTNSTPGETIKLYICKASDCSDCRTQKTAVSNLPTLWSNGTSIQVSPGNTTDTGNNNWGYFSIYDASTTTSYSASWTWDFGSSRTGNFSILWLGKLTSTTNTGFSSQVIYNISVSNDGTTWTYIDRDYLNAGVGQTGLGYTYTNYHLTKVYGTYRYVRANMTSTATGRAYNATLWVDFVRVDEEFTSNCWNFSSAVSSNPACTYKCPSCTYAVNTYYATTCSQQDYACTATTSALTFTCKKENLCACSAGECYSGTGSGVNEGCKQDPDGSGAWCCNTNQCSHDGSCYTLVELPSSGASACILGENIAHNTQGSTNYRYAVYDGQLYYCGTSNEDKDPYPETADLIPRAKIGACQCNWDGTWNCGGIIKIRGTRIKIVS